MTRATLAALAAALVLTPSAEAARSLDAIPLPMQLPGEAHAAAASTWLVGATPGARSRTIARRYGAHELLVRGAYRVAPARARAFAAALRRAGALRWAQADHKLSRQAAFEGREDAWARGAVVPSGLAIPVPGRVKIGFVDDAVDRTVADLQPITTFANDRPAADVHGTETASNAAAPRNGIGVVGVFPGVPIISWGTTLTCSDIAQGILTDLKLGAKVINLSLGGEGFCTPMFEATQIAYGAGALVVASAGNEGEDGNPIEYPSSYPHVLSVGAINEAGQPSSFSNSNPAIDVAAPGENVPVDIPVAADTKDGKQDGVTTNDGTSFSSPIVAGAAAFLMAAKPSLTVGQVGDIFRESAVDVPPAGYDSRTGYGLVNLPRALGAPVPANDPNEPNDDISSVNGTTFNKPDAYVFSGSGTRTLRATVDATEDPYDVYRVRFPARSRLNFALRIRGGGDSDLYAFARNATSILRSRYVARSRRTGTRTDSFTIRNSARSARTGYIVVVSPSLDDPNDLGSRYSLTFKRLRS